ncbi:NUP-domain-containing protein [Trametopsis cervina]|nr:NUP-domain-containing protein [Trametopsis cervina]
MVFILSFPVTLAAIVCALATACNAAYGSPGDPQQGFALEVERIEPKVFIFGMFSAEGQAWYGIPEFNLLERNISVPGFSLLYPDVHCTSSGSICQLVTGEGEINAVATVSALIYSNLFDLRRTYFLIAGVAGISPKMATIGGVTFARFAVHVGLQFEIDAREVPAHFATGYIPQGAETPDQYPTRIYGTEVYELNDNLRRRAIDLANRATLVDDKLSHIYRTKYASNPDHAPALSRPSVVACDTATSDQYWSGSLLAEAMENVTRLLTNGTAEYCTSQQEDNATLEALLRAAVRGAVDFSRILILRTGSDFERPYEGQTAADNLFHGLVGFASSIANLRLAGVQVVRGIVDEWEETYLEGVKADNYVGDIFGSLGGQPDFGPVKI